MPTEKARYGLSLVLAAGLIASACATPATPMVQTQVVTQIVAGTPVERVVEVTPTPVPAQQKDTVVIGTWQQPRSFSPYANNQSITAEIDLLIRPRFVMRNDFGFAANPDLVDGDLPSIDRNDGSAVFNTVDVKAGEPIFDPEKLTVVRAAADASGVKQLVVTGKLRPGLKWSDGEPLTAHDLVFTWKTNCSDGSGALDLTNCPLDSAVGAVGQLVNYEAVDDTTVRATYVPGAVDPVYFITVFAPYGVIPEHQFKGLTAEEILNDERHLGGETVQPLGYGPYKMTEWAKGDHLTVEPDPFWSGSKPVTGKVIYKFYADATAVSAAVIAGEIDASSGITGINVDQVPFMTSTAKQGVINFETDPNAASFEMLYLNYYDPKDPTFKTPHPVLGDYAVRKAIALALDRQQMVDTIFFGGSTVVEQPQLPQMMSYDESAGSLSFDPNAAAKLLEEAGWVDSDGDGVRERNGVRASVNYITTSGSTPRQRAAQIIQASLGKIGIEVNLNFQPSSVVFSTDVLYNRNFDMIQFANTFTVVDPGSWWFGIANCGQIPLPENNFSGGNYAGWCEQTTSDAVAQAAFLTLDTKERQDLYREAVQHYFAPPEGDAFETGGFPLIPLHLRPNYLGTVPGLDGAALDSTELFTWNSQVWSLHATVN